MRDYRWMLVLGLGAGFWWVFSQVLPIVQLAVARIQY